VILKICIAFRHLFVCFAVAHELATAEIGNLYCNYSVCRRQKDHMSEIRRSRRSPKLSRPYYYFLIGRQAKRKLNLISHRFCGRGIFRWNKFDQDILIVIMADRVVRKLTLIHREASDH